MIDYHPIRILTHHLPYIIIILTKQIFKPHSPTPIPASLVTPSLPTSSKLSSFSHIPSNI
jgi:hypothetical protein